MGAREIDAIQTGQLPHRDATERERVQTAARDALATVARIVFIVRTESLFRYAAAKYHEPRDRSARLSSREILFEFMKDRQLRGRHNASRSGPGECCSARTRVRRIVGLAICALRREDGIGIREGSTRVGYTRLSCRDGCSIMSTCSTCQPLRLNRSLDYPMTHNADPPMPCRRPTTATHPRRRVLPATLSAHPPDPRQLAAAGMQRREAIVAL